MPHTRKTATTITQQIKHAHTTHVSSEKLHNTGATRHNRPGHRLAPVWSPRAPLRGTPVSMPQPPSEATGQCLQSRGACSLALRMSASTRVHKLPIGTLSFVTNTKRHISTHTHTHANIENAHWTQHNLPTHPGNARSFAACWIVRPRRQRHRSLLPHGKQCYTKHMHSGVCAHSLCL